jgi:hypothetical protein
LQKDLRACGNGSVEWSRLGSDNPTSRVSIALNVDQAHVSYGSISRHSADDALWGWDIVPLSPCQVDRVPHGFVYSRIGVRLITRVVDVVDHSPVDISMSFDECRGKGAERSGENSGLHDREVDR